MTALIMIIKIKWILLCIWMITLNGYNGYASNDFVFSENVKVIKNNDTNSEFIKREGFAPIVYPGQFETKKILAKQESFSFPNEESPSVVVEKDDMNLDTRMGIDPNVQSDFGYIKEKFSNVLSPFFNQQPVVEKNVVKYGYKTSSHGQHPGGYGHQSPGGYGHQSPGGYGSHQTGYGHGGGYGGVKTVGYGGGYGVKTPSGGYGVKTSHSGYGVKTPGGYGAKTAAAGGVGLGLGVGLGMGLSNLHANEICNPPLNQPANAKLECNNNMCKAACMINYQFPNGATILNLKCINMEWIIQGVEWNEIPSCEPICLPTCKNQGICIEPGLCSCPENFIGPQCENEKKLCVTPPSLPKNSKRSCSSTACAITCMSGYRFPDGTSVTNMVCKEGQWIPTRQELAAIPDCQPICNPPCQNGGNCLSYNVCQCPQNYRGPQCQYSIDACSPKRLQFNGAYNCSANNDEIQCALSCPHGVTFEFPPANFYVCGYALGVFQPFPVPKCQFPEGMEVVQTGDSQKTFFNTANQSYGSRKKIKKKKIHNMSADDDDEDEDDTYEEVITKTKIRIIKGKKKKKHGMYEEEEEEEEEEYEQMPGTYSLYLANEIDVMMRTPKPAVCMTWNGNKVKTFDGLIYNRNLHCSHTLVQDYIDGSFSVVLRACTFDAQLMCSYALEIFMQQNQYTIDNKDGIIRLRTPKKELPIPSQLVGIRVAMVGNKLLVDMASIGMTIQWDGYKLVTVEATAGLWNRTAGLCGTLDQNLGNDFMSKDGSRHKLASTFVDSWKAPTLDADPTKCIMGQEQNDGLELQCPMDVEIKAIEVCEKLLSNPKYENCLKVFAKESMLKTCVSDYCFCVDTQNPAKCACSGMSVFAKDCQFRGIALDHGWRDMSICPITCTGGRVYKSCGPSMEPSCGSAYDATIDTCHEGCFCPPDTIQHNGTCIPIELCPCTWRGKAFPANGKITKDCNTCACERGIWKCSDITCGARCGAIGDPHYVTFDGKRFNFMGKCSYHLLKMENFSIEAENVACSGTISEGMNFGTAGIDMPSCTKSVTINIHLGEKQKTIKLKQGRQVTVDGFEIQRLPIRVLDGFVKVRQASSTMTVVAMADGLKVWWDGRTRVYIDAPPTYRGQTKGLCGTFNSNIQDDFLTPEGDIESEIGPFADKWRTKETCQYVSKNSEIPHPCQLNVEKVTAAKDYCAKLKNEIFSECHWYVDPNEYYEDCLYDLCACKDDISNCACPIFASYAAECSRHGVIVNWRHSVKECAVQCPPGQVFEECGDECYRTCEDLQSNEACKSTCVEGCRCPTGQSLDENNECIPTGKCQCVHNGLTFKSGYKEVRAGIKHLELCTCLGAKWICLEAKDGDSQRYPPAADIRTKCLSFDNQEFTTCEPAEPITCKNMNDYHPSTTVECHAGCVCKSGFVFDVMEKRCVLPQDCSCHHGSKSYKDGDKIRSDCNTCMCKAGAWDCTTLECPATCTSWGDSHFETFDGKDFDFQGVCSYVLSKGSLAGGEGYSVTIQNVLCGSLGVTCSKSVTVTITGPHTETITLSADTPIPGIRNPFQSSNEIMASPFGALKKLSVHRAGIFLVVEAPGMGLQVKWDRGTRAYVKLGIRWKNRVQGLCGNFNGDAQDDLKTPSSGIETSAVLFGDSWKLQDFCAKPTEQIDTCQEHPQRKTWSQRQCGILKSDIFKRCHSEVPVEPYLKRCTYDACACDQGGDCQCLCTALATYAHACSTKGVPIRWRTPDLCPMQCDPLCSQYTPCLSTCPIETCDNVLQQGQEQRMCLDDTCVEGCQLKPCSENQIYFNESYSECVPKSTCKTECLKVNDVVYYEGDIIESDPCHTCRCTRGNKVCSGTPCTIVSVTEQIPQEPHKDADDKCTSGWTIWFNQDVGPIGEMNKSAIKIGDKEPLPTKMFLQSFYGSPTCDIAFMKQIECRTVGTQMAPKVMGEDVECSLERGLLCAGPCHDYETRVLCDCKDEIDIFTLPPVIPIDKQPLQPILIGSPCDPSVPHIEFPGDCYKFLHCEPAIDGSWKYAEKTCGPSMMFNPANMICDWPASVMAIKPLCGVPQDLVTPIPLIPTLPTIIQLKEQTTPFILPPPIVLPVGPMVHTVCDPTVPHIEFPGDCHKFLHCEPAIDGAWKYAEKTCGPSMMFNPTNMICDWPASVIAIKPMCGEPIIKPIPPTLPPFIVPAKCPPGQVWNECATPCGKACHFYGQMLLESGLCVFGSQACIEGCVDALAVLSCPNDYLWRDNRACVAKADCTCISRGGQMVKPGAIFHETDCEICQCIDSAYICDSSDCVKKVVTQSYLEEIIVAGKTTVLPIILPSSVTPPSMCDPKRLIPMIEGENPLLDAAFNASSSKGPTFMPQFSRLHSEPTEFSSGSWSPQIDDQMQYLQIAFDKPTPLFGVKIRGSPKLDQYVTSFKILHSFDGIAFHYLVDETMTPQIFRGPIDANTPVESQFKIPIESKVLRIYPLTWHKSIAIRIELFGCAKDVPTTVSPLKPLPIECDPKMLVPMIEGENPLPDTSFGASSSLGSSFLPQYSRLHSKTTDSSSGSWSPEINDQMQYLQIAFPEPTPLFGVIIRGSPIFDQFVKKFKILHSIDGKAFNYLIDETETPQIFPGSIDSRTPVRTLFKIPIKSKVLRIYPLVWHGSISMRIELLGCSTSKFVPTILPPIVHVTTVKPPEILNQITSPKPHIDEHVQMMCDEPMGVDNGKMSPQQIKTSSVKHGIKPFNALKLSAKKGWNPNINSPNEFVHFDFMDTRTLTGIKTKGGEYGWVTAYNVLYSPDDLFWSKVLDDDGTPKTFLGNYDSETIKVNNFKMPLNARHLKIVPIKWHETIEMMVEPVGCFKPYPLLENEIVVETTTTKHEIDCGKCPGVLYSESPIEGTCRCYPPLFWNGGECVSKAQCPCMVGHIQYEVGAKYETEDCSQCTCVLGGMAQCKPQICPPCKTGLRPIKTATCVCLCEPCPLNQILCPTSSVCIPETAWCDGIQDCPDDELQCGTKDKESAKIITKVEEKMTIIKTCPDPSCPPGFLIKEIKPNAPRLSAMFQTPQGVKSAYTKSVNAYKNKVPSYNNQQQSNLPVPKTIEEKLKDECMEYICVPIRATVPPSLIDVKKPIICQEPSCPIGYKVIMELGNLLSGTMGQCAKYSCEPIPKNDAVCNITGRTFNTFDGVEFKYDICNHLLARDLVEEKWSISILKNCTSGNYICTKQLMITDRVANSQIILYPDLTLQLDGYHFTVDQLQKSTIDKMKTFVVSKVGNTIIFVSHLHSFWTTFDEYGDVKIGVTAQQATTVDGLCGYFNRKSNDDKRLPNGEPALSTIDFGDSWFVNRSAEKYCEPHACPKDIQDIAWEMCNTVKHDAFVACKNVINVGQFVSKCLEAACDCLKNAQLANNSLSLSPVMEKQCKCSMLQSFAVECLAADESVHLDTWRFAHDCKALCPLPMVHKDCFRRRCEPSCDTLAADDCPHLPGSCFSGCYCPEGMVKKGDRCVPVSECRDCVCDGFGRNQHVTYDRKNFTFDGNCTYLLSRDLLVQDVHTFQVYATLGPCDKLSGNTPAPTVPGVKGGIKGKVSKVKPVQPSCTQALHILYGPHILHLERSENSLIRTLIDGIEVKELPMKRDWIEIENQQNREIKIQMPKSQVELSASFDDLAFAIRVPSVKYGMKMEGLCGDCNGNPDNDLQINPKSKLKKIEGQEPAFKDIIQSWLAADEPKLPTEEHCVSVEEAELDCIPLPPEEDPCMEILNEDAFGKCHLIVDPIMYLSACQTDMCKTGPNQLGACSHVGAYAKECSRNGLCVNWRKPKFCPADQMCPEGMIFEPCGCAETCDTLKQRKTIPPPPIPNAQKLICPIPRQEGCVCPPGKVIANGKCIPELQCTPCDDKQHYPGDKWFPEKCKECECTSNSTILCTQKQCASTGSVCELGYKQLIIDADPNECCPEYKCVPETTKPPSIKCPETPLPNCGPDQYNKKTVDSNDCPKYICECIPVEQCKKPDTKPILKPGEKLVTEITGCCPINKIVCDKSQCPPKPQKCNEPFHDLIQVITDAINSPQCCEEYVCKPPVDKCIAEVNGVMQLKSRDEKWPTLKACIELQCVYGPDGQLTITEVIQKCDVPVCALGAELIVEPGKCCGTCVPVKCVIGTEIYAPGQEWSTKDNCTTFTCNKLDNQLVVTTSQPTCPDISGCPENLQYFDNCCTKCKPVAEDQKNCMPLSLSDMSTIGMVEQFVLEHGVCKNPLPVRGYTECSGSCNSGTKYNRDNFKQKRQCQCCSVGIYEELTVSLKCENGAEAKQKISVPKSCSCQPCEEHQHEYALDVRMGDDNATVGNNRDAKFIIAR